MDVIVSLDLILKAGQKVPAFYHELTAVGTVEGDKLRVSQTAFQRLNRKHFGQLAMGNFVHQLVQPVASALGLDDCSDCAERQLKLNTAAKN